MAKVYVKDDLEKSLKQFKAQVNSENILKEYVDRTQFTSKSELNRIRKKKERRKALRKLHKIKQLEKLL